MSTRLGGVSTSSFIRSSRLVPPAMNVAPSRLMRVASAVEPARE